MFLKHRKEVKPFQQNCFCQKVKFTIIKRSFWVKKEVLEKKNWLHFLFVPVDYDILITLSLLQSRNIIDSHFAIFDCFGFVSRLLSGTKTSCVVCVGITTANLTTTCSSKIWVWRPLSNISSTTTPKESADLLNDRFPVLIHTGWMDMEDSCHGRLRGTFLNHFKIEKKCLKLEDRHDIYTITTWF